MRLIARFAQEEDEYFEIITVYDERVIKERINKRTPALISITKEYPAAIWFERKIADDFGIKILYSNDNRPLVKHEHFPQNVYPMRKSYQETSLEVKEKRKKMHQGNKGVIIGPTHPYHLESSQLQLFDRNKKILHFEVMPFYKYRAIEKMLEGLTLTEATPIVERICGSMSIAYQTAFLEIQLQASKKELPEIIKKKNMFLHEFERVIHNLNDLATLCQLIGFKDASFFLMSLLEQARISFKRLTGHRFAFGAIGSNYNLLEVEQAYEYLFFLENELIWFEKSLERRKGVLDKLKGQGIVSAELVKRYGLVGIMARSSSVVLDRRLNSKLYMDSDFYTTSEKGEDAFARFNIRLKEISLSLRMMKIFLKENRLPFYLGTPVDGEYYAYVESSAGELMMYVKLKNGLINRFFVRDPSFLNAQVLSHIMKNSEFSKLATTLKSIPLNFSAIDL